MIVTDDQIREELLASHRREPGDAVHEGHARDAPRAASRPRRCAAWRRPAPSYAAMDILPDPRIRQVLSAHSGWPTIPQLFVDGELVGGCDIVTELYESGELQQLVAPLPRRSLAPPPLSAAGVIGLSARPRAGAGRLRRHRVRAAHGGHPAGLLAGPLADLPPAYRRSRLRAARRRGDRGVATARPQRCCCTNGLLMHGHGRRAGPRRMERGRDAGRLAGAGRGRRALSRRPASTAPVLCDARRRRGAGRRRAAGAGGAGSTCARGSRVDDPRELDGGRGRACAPAPGSGGCSTCRWSPGSSRSRTSPARPTTGPRWSTIGRHRATALLRRWSRRAWATRWPRTGCAGEWDPDRPDRPVDPRSAAAARRARARVVPRPRPAAGPLARPACTRMTPDSDFILDTIDGVVVCGGDSGHAFKFGPLLGRLAPTWPRAATCRPRQPVPGRWDRSREPHRPAAVSANQSARLARP